MMLEIKGKFDMKMTNKIMMKMTNEDGVESDWRLRMRIKMKSA